MKRYLLFILLFLFASNHFTKKLHDVLNVIENVVYYNNTNDTDHLGEKCLDQDFDIAYEQFIYGIKKKSSNEMSLSLITMFTELSSNCNLKNIANIMQTTIKKYEKMSLLEIFFNIFPKCMKSFENFVDYYHDPNQTHFKLGEIIGNLLKILN